MIRFVCAIFILLASQAGAEVIQVQSGDHPGFTRLVLAIPDGRDWQLGRQGDDYVIDTGGPTDSFDLTQAFNLIGRNRLAALLAQAAPGRLHLDLACLCHATAFRWQTDWVVVDIVDGPAASDSQFEASIEPDSDVVPTIAAGPGAAMQDFSLTQSPDLQAELNPTTMVSIPESAAPVLVLPLVMNGHSSVDLPGTLPVTPLPTPLQPMPDAAAMADQISATEQAIIESFARAATQGLLEVSVAPDSMSKPDDPPADPTPEGGDHMDNTHPLGDPMEVSGDNLETKPSALAGFALQSIDPDQPGIVSHTSVDRNAAPLELPDEHSAVGDRCLDDALFDMDGWGDDRDFSTQFGEKLGALTAEFDIYPEGSVEDLVRFYLFFGFGLEALQTLRLDGIDSQERRVMEAMAHVADEEPDPSGIFDSQLGCATQAAIWTALSRRTLENTTEAERTAAIEGFRALPTMLRGHLGVALAQYFVDFGDPDSAETILDAARDHITADRAETDVTSAEIMLASQGAEVAIPALRNIAEADIRLTPEALTQLINLTLDEGQPLDPGLITLAESMAYEHRGEPVGAMLIAAQARALTAAGAYAQVFSLLDSDIAPMATSEIGALRSAAILSLTDRSDDAAFLNFAFDALPATENAEVENAVAARVLALGFADRANALLTSPASGPAERDRRYLQADIALALGDFAEVEAYLAGMTDPRATETRARALVAQGEFAAAATIRNALPGVVQTPDEVWRAGEWSALEQSDDALLRAASGAVLAPSAAADPASPLAASRALLEQAAATRDLAGQLLDRFAVEPATATGTN